MNIALYEVKDMDGYRFGRPSSWVLEEPKSLSRTWIKPAEYKLPDGYTVGLSKAGELCIRNRDGKHCTLHDNVFMGHGGGKPILNDSTLPTFSPKLLEKVRDLSYEDAERLNWEALNASTGQKAPIQAGGEEMEEAEM